MLVYALPLLFCAALIPWPLSCNNDKCEDVICPYNQICYEGICACNNGWEGDSCKTSSIPRFLGNYDVNEYALSGVTPAPLYSSTISAGSSDNVIFISNFSNTGITIKAQIATSTVTRKGTHISINDASGVLEVQGEGEYNESLNRIDLQCNIKQEFQSRTCQVTFIKL